MNKFTLTFKTPNVLDALEQEDVDACCLTHFENGHAYDSECDECNIEKDIAEEKAMAIKALTDKFIRYGECITIEFDLTAGTATVVQVK